jgi:nitrite reductase/ring-hydroxylating ferredoxin subunit
MRSGEIPESGLDLTRGIPVAELTDGIPLLGRVGEQTVLLVRRGREVLAVRATCKRYSGPLAERIVVGDTVRCLWHHACFSLRTGAARRRSGPQRAAFADPGIFRMGVGDAALPGPW